MPRSPAPKPSPPDPAALARVSLLTGRWAERLLAPLTVAQYLALHAARDGGLEAAALARATGVSAAAISQLVIALEADGLLDRTRAAADRRRQTIALTHAGRRALRSAEARLAKALGGLLEDLAPHEAHGLADALGVLESRLAGTPPPVRRRPPPPPPPPRHR